MFQLIFLTGTEGSGAKGSGAHQYSVVLVVLVLVLVVLGVVVIVIEVAACHYGCQYLKNHPRTTKTITRTTRTALASVHQAHLNQTHLCPLEQILGTPKKSNEY